jgi:hypothetical protein
VAPLDHRRLAADAAERELAASIAVIACVLVLGLSLLALAAVILRAIHLERRKR